MIQDVIFKKLTVYEDARGWLAEIYRNDEDHYQPAMGYISVTRPGVARGRTNINIRLTVLSLLVLAILNYIFGIVVKIVRPMANILKKWWAKVIRLW